MSAYSILEALLVAVIVAGCAFALALRLLPAGWLKAPFGAWLDRPGNPAAFRLIGARWHAASAGGACANGCCASGDGCAIGRSTESPVAVAVDQKRRIPLSVNRDAIQDAP